MTLHLPPVAESPPDLDSTTVHLLQPVGPAERRILTPEALHFLGRMSHRFEPQRQFILEQRRQRQAELDAGEVPDFPSETRELRNSNWRVAPIPADLRVRRVEITGPVDRKMIINALNSGADVFMADFEDSNAPTWLNCIEGHVNLCDAVRRAISYTSPEGKPYRLNERIATLMVRPRGWHLCEKHVLVEGQPISGSMFDFGLYLFHNADALRAAGSGPYFYLPKLESHLEARLWNDVFVWSQRELGIPQGTIRATVLIETILAAFEMDEILWELRDHSAGLNCGRWDYIFSLIKKFSTRPEFVLSDRVLVTMTTPFMRAYSQLVIKTCHRRGIHAIGGMAAQIPIKSDAFANDVAIAKVRADKQREVSDGHDGTWVAHPGLVGVAMEEFAKIDGTDQLQRLREDVTVTAAELLTVPRPPQITEQGVRTNIRVGIQYLESWLRGSGCVPINNLMEDAATAEISRAQLWQWVHHKSAMDDGRTITLGLVGSLIADELANLRERFGSTSSAQLSRAAELFQRMTENPRFPEFLTSVAYKDL